MQNHEQLGEITEIMELEEVSKSYKRQKFVLSFMANDCPKPRMQNCIFTCSNKHVKELKGVKIGQKSAVKFVIRGKELPSGMAINTLEAFQITKSEQE